MARVERDRTQRGVGAGLADAVQPAAVVLHAADAAHARGQHRQHAAVAGLAGFDIGQHQRQRHHRAEHVDVHHLVELLRRDRLRAFGARAQHAGVVDRHVERFAVELPAQAGDSAGIRQVGLVGFGAKRLQRAHAFRRACRRNDTPAVGTVLADEFKADAAGGTEDQDGWQGWAPLSGLTPLSHLWERGWGRGEQTSGRRRVTKSRSPPPSLPRRQCTGSPRHACRRSCAARRSAWS
ncbi:hypothetical protein FQZ97_906920 [compost metagenome]